LAVHASTSLMRGDYFKGGSMSPGEYTSKPGRYPTPASLLSSNDIHLPPVPAQSPAQMVLRQDLNGPDQMPKARVVRVLCNGPPRVPHDPKKPDQALHALLVLNMSVVYN
jgi:hypothetical protein